MLLNCLPENRFRPVQIILTDIDLGKPYICLRFAFILLDGFLIEVDRLVVFSRLTRLVSSGNEPSIGIQIQRDPASGQRRKQKKYQEEAAHPLAAFRLLALRLAALPLTFRQIACGIPALKSRIPPVAPSIPAHSHITARTPADSPVRTSHVTACASAHSSHVTACAPAHSSPGIPPGIASRNTSASSGIRISYRIIIYIISITFFTADGILDLRCEHILQRIVIRDNADFLTTFSTIYHSFWYLMSAIAAFHLKRTPYLLLIHHSPDS